MTPARALEYARRITATTCEYWHPHDGPGTCVDCENAARQILPILREAITESVEDHLVSVLAASKGGQA